MATGLWRGASVNLCENAERDPMHRAALLRLIDDYADRHPEESATVQDFIRFVEHHERCFERDLWAGHVTGSAWLVNGAGTHVLMTHHRKLDRWLQLGGHSDGNPDTLAVAMREAEEESGLRVKPVFGGIFDLDIHEIPARKADPAHFHYDLRFALQPVFDESYTVGAESLDLAWVALERLDDYTTEWSVLRMRSKWFDLGHAQSF